MSADSKLLSKERFDQLRRLVGLDRWQADELLNEVTRLRAENARLQYELAEEKNANANDRDPSYHEERLKRENEALARQLVAATARADNLATSFGMAHAENARQAETIARLREALEGWGNHAEDSGWHSTAEEVRRQLREALKDSEGKAGVK